MALPQSILDMAELPGVTDVSAQILRAALPEMRVDTEIAMQTTFPLVIVRRERRFTRPGGDERGIASAAVDVNTFTSGIDADYEGEMLHEAIRVAFRDAWLTKMPIVTSPPCVLVRVERELEPYRSPDWATATGPVQYADLPTSVQRWECSYRITYRRADI